MSSDELEELRQKIDALDEELLKTLVKRLEVVREVGRYKKAKGLDLRDDERLKALLEERLKTAGQLGLPEELVKELYELIHDASLDAESDA
ncbi:MAG TPA: chorismate mutase [Candidatus Saccharimonadales bacterium]|nr:chorismate mutase [Candidatus Saccharimonadales bacterium]